MAEQKFYSKSNQNKNLKKVIVVESEPQEFNQIISTCTLTSSDLELKIANFFNGIFDDFEGCKIHTAGNTPGLKLTIYFKPCFSKQEDGLYAINVRGQNVVKNDNPYDLSTLVKNVNMVNNSKLFDLDDTAKEILSEFVLMGPNFKEETRFSEELNKPVKIRLVANWKPYVQEIADNVVPGNAMYTNQQIGVTLDLLPIVSKLYGKKDPKQVKEYAARNAIPKNRYEYDVQIARVVNTRTQTYILEIRRIDREQIDKLAGAIGYGYSYGNIIMTRPR